MRRFLVALFAALALAPRLVYETVVEAGRLVWRAVRTVYPPTPALIEEAAEQELAQERREDAVPTVQGLDGVPPELAWGRAAMALLCDEIPPGGILDDAAEAYVERLDPVARGLLAAYPEADIGAHLLGQRPLPGLPRVPTLAEHHRSVNEAYVLLSRARSAAEAEQAWVSDVLAWLADKREHEPDYADYAPA